jgi:hypothetical protein
MFPDRLDRPALISGLVLAVVVAVPAGLASNAFDDNSSAVLVLTVAVMVALVGGAARAAARQTLGFPLVHGICVAVVAVAIAQVIGIVRRVIIDERIRAGAVASNFLLALIAGTVGGLIGSRRADR